MGRQTKDPDILGLANNRTVKYKVKILYPFSSSQRVRIVWVRRCPPLETYDLQEQKLIAEIRKIRAKRVLLQFPEGLRRLASRICRLIEDNTDALPMVSIDPCYGACDLPTHQGERLGVELIVHFGHSPHVVRLIFQSSSSLSSSNQ